MKKANATQTKAKWPKMLTAAGLVGGGAAAILWAGGSSKQAGRTPTQAVQQAAVPMVNGRTACVFDTGVQWAYDINITTDIKLATKNATLPSGVQVNAPAPRRSTHAVLSLRALANEGDDGTVLLGRLSDVDSETVAQAGDLSAPFLLRVSASCKLEQFARLDTTEIPLARTQQAIAYELQFTVPAGQRTLTNGESSFGAFSASFERFDEGALAKVTRHILSYRQVWGRDASIGFKPAVKVDAPKISVQEVTLGMLPWFDSLKSREVLEGLAIIDTDNQVSVEKGNFVPGVLDDAPSERSRYVWENLFLRPLDMAANDTEGVRNQKELAELRTLTLDQALERFYALLEKDENIAKLWPMLSKYIEARPEMAAKLAAMLRKLEIPAEGTAAAFLALGKANVPEARQALWSLKDDSKARTMDRARAAFALVDRKDVGVELAKSLASDAKDVNTGADRMSRIFAREAALALGMMGGLKGASDPEVKRVAVASALDLLHQGTDQASLSPAFGAIANIGDPALLANVAPYVYSNDPGVRSAAAISVRRMPPEQTAGMTADWLRRESDPEVKRELYHVISLQTADAQTQADRAIISQAIVDLAAQPSPLTRQSLIRILGDAKDRFPEAKAALIRQVKIEIDHNEGLIKVLSHYLDASEINQGMAG
ncbi:MAG: hypothetical protein SF187_03900 [Deltaproteobacteria bacterium]|nr:hypothetical protein [Deltaproteobacteria bacterium]